MILKVKKKKEKSLFSHSFIFTLIFYITLAFLLWYLIIPNTSIYYKKGHFLPFFHRLNDKDIILTPGEEFTLRVQNINKRVKFSSLDIKVAGVTPFGTIVAFRPGRTFVTAKYDDNELRCRVRVINLNKKKLNLKVDETYDLDVKGLGFFSRVRWSSNKKSVVKVNRFGKVVGVSKGRAVITAKVGKKTLKCQVVVK